MIIDWLHSRCCDFSHKDSVLAHTIAAPFLRWNAKIMNTLVGKNRTIYYSFDHIEDESDSNINLHTDFNVSFIYFFYLSHQSVFVILLA